MTIQQPQQLQDQNTFKVEKAHSISNLRIVSMIPGDRKVDG